MAPGDDPMGGTTQFTMKRLDDLHIMPDATGGRTVVNTNEPESQVPSILDESQSYYLIGFARTSGVNDGKLHSIKIKVNRSDVDVRYRNGYYASDELAAASAPEKLPVAKALDRVLPDSDIPLSVTAAAFATQGKPSAGVAVVIDVNDPVVASSAGGGTGAAPSTKTHDSVLAAMFDATGHSVATSRQTITMTRRAGSSGPSEISRGCRPIRDAMRSLRRSMAKLVSAAPCTRLWTYPDFAKAPLSLSDIVLHAEPARAGAAVGRLRGPRAVRPHGATDVRIGRSRHRIGQPLRSGVGAERQRLGSRADRQRAQSRRLHGCLIARGGPLRRVAPGRVPSGPAVIGTGRRRVSS